MPKCLNFITYFNRRLGTWLLKFPPVIHLHSDSFLRLKLCLMNVFSWQKPGKNLYSGKTSNMPPNNKTTEIRINEFHFKNLKLESPRAFRPKHNVKLEWCTQALTMIALLQLTLSEGSQSNTKIVRMINMFCFHNSSLQSLDNIRSRYWQTVWETFSKALENHKKSNSTDCEKP